MDKPEHGNTRYTQCHIHSLGRRDNSIYLYDSLIVTIKPKVSEYCNVTRGMVSNDILECGRPGDVLNNYTSGYGVEVHT